MRISDWSSDVCSSDLRKRKLPVTALLYALGLTPEDMLGYFYNKVTFVRGEGGWQIPYTAGAWRGQKPAFDIVDAKSGEVVFAAGHTISPRAANKAETDGLETLLIDRKSTRLNSSH